MDGVVTGQHASSVIPRDAKLQRRRQVMSDSGCQMQEEMVWRPGFEMLLVLVGCASHPQQLQLSFLVLANLWLLMEVPGKMPSLAFDSLCNNISRYGFHNISNAGWREITLITT